MAEFCTVCANKLGFPPDINIDTMFLDITPEHYLEGGFICEGCALVAIGKTKEGLPMFGVYNEDSWKTELEHFGMNTNLFSPKTSENKHE